MAPIGKVRNRLAHTGAAAAAAVAAAAGSAARFVSLTGASIGGATLISYGLGEVYRPLMFIAAGGFLLLIDRKQTVERKQDSERRTGR